MRLRDWFLCLFLLASIGALAHAVCPRAPASRAPASIPIVSKPVVVTKNAVIIQDPRGAVRESLTVVKIVTPVTELLAVPVLVPAYTASYVPAPVVPPPAPSSLPAAAGSADLKAIAEALKAIGGRLDALERRGDSRAPASPPRMPGASEPEASASPSLPAGAHPGLGVMLSACASCHEQKVAGDRGAGIVLLEGRNLAKLSDRTVRDVLSDVYRGRMPRGSKLNDEQVAQVIDLFSLGK